MGRHEATRKWAKKQNEGSRPPAEAGNGRGKRQKLMSDDPEDTSATPFVSHGKVVNMSIVHGPQVLEKFPENTAFTFPYLPLDSSKSEIRTIILKPGTVSMPLECTLQHVSNASKSRASYKALSYTWGPPEPTKILVLNGIQIQVRENLWQALHHIRQEGSSLRLWVDALCINQEDIPERNEQVSRMGTLYNQAEEVLVWLGPEKDGSDIAISFIKTSIATPSRSLPLDLSSDLYSQVEVQSVLSLLDREYWKRVWIIQEVFRARKILIFCGHERLPWKDLAKFFRQVKKLPDSDLHQIAMHPSREAITAISHNPAATLTDHRTTRFEDLESLLMSYDGSYCCDPRDKVYALLGLARKRQLAQKSRRILKKDWLSIDYSRSPHDLFRELTLMYMAEVGGCFLVRWVQMLQRILDLPPPWSILGTPFPLMSVGQVSCRIYLPANVSSVGPHFTWSPDAQNPRRAWGRSQDQHPDLHFVTSEHVAISEWYSQFLGPRMPSRITIDTALRRLNEDDIARLESFKHAEWLTGAPQPDQTACETVNTTSGAIATKVRLFTTCTGRLGLTSCEIKELDRVVRFFGSDVALVVSEVLLPTSDVIERRVKGRAFILASDNTAKDPDFLASYNGKSRWAVPSLLDRFDIYFDANMRDLKWDTAAPAQSYQKEVERFEVTRDDTHENLPVYWGMTTREWEFWTW